MKLKAVVFSVMFFGCYMLAHAQAPTHVPLMNDTWRLIAQKKYVKNAQYKMVPSFPKKLEDLENKVLEFSGYLIPLKAEMEYTNFMLAVVPYDQCAYCGQGDVPSMIEVYAKKGVNASDRPVKIRGKLVLNKTGDKRSEIFLMDAELIN
ncbi:hypothetical protein ADIARSV_3780 [Arcticibacter svalbardensis MN12-7]|uniref:DUF3299 domain-containing protein n=1 Tax=Arcticibacter svalbardensis MN12-7 TaxID=1150600 RepID=R9GND4_9SPHI|nr:hypothetical protein [Arcticibacter svalbardensis]EOR93045.1 hypothetical protein ADIARSV_3780 [Arcticibacter svalbardensis MN12-7]